MKRMITAGLDNAGIELITYLGYGINENGKFEIWYAEYGFEEFWLATYDPIEDDIDLYEKVDDIEEAIDIAENSIAKQCAEFVMEMKL